MSRLLEMLRYRRPHGSGTEKAWVKKFILPYQPIEFSDRHTSETMAYAVIVDKDGLQEPKVLFSCHTDTVHHKEGMQSVKRSLLDGAYHKQDGDPLGADDAAGCWLMLEMIDAKVPGTYVFHRGEEKGGIGSSWMADNMAHWLRTYKYAIAFDRKATDSIITHQGYGRCCSDAFGNALAEALNGEEPAFMYSPDDTGLFTDTANYVDHIGECTNVSVGYYDEHTGRERLDVHHLELLRGACIAMGDKWHDLPTVRKAGEVEYVPMPVSRFSFNKREEAPSTVYNLYDMDKEAMIEAASWDVDAFIDAVRYELAIEDDIKIEDETEDDTHYPDFRYRM